MEEIGMELFDVGCYQYSVEWSAEESAILDGLLHDNSSDDAATPKPSSHSIVLKRYRKKKRTEFLELKRAAQELEVRLMQLSEAKQLRDVLSPPGRWQKIAVQLKMDTAAAHIENKQLKELVQAHLVTVQTLGSMLDKTHELALTLNPAPEMRWQQLVLVADPDLRRAGIHGIMDRECGKLASVFIEAGLTDAKDEFQKHISKLSVSGGHEFHVVVHRHLGLPVSVALERCWDVSLGASMFFPSLPHQTLSATAIDANTSYVVGWLNHPLGRFQRRALCKRFPGEKRSTLIVRSIDLDEDAPYDPSLPYAIEVIWVQFDARMDGGTDVKVFQKFRPSHWTADMLATVQWPEALEKGALDLHQAIHDHIETRTVPCGTSNS
ncbi:hypothetical protein SDRG_01115 [Saprolegnia diclina VS20]|uniref:START domain-containing protein n=1 Tax=Saprolegnia diclina (strain VS20) TaxID=1156394 RepID=T0SE33_SAPDV|nr:hypothetical protein SDRG_01115 [Saprolegnia diclina VS20]EQC41137.1 hypothetical protein SDRG_01115 [Saprolegnia diclina VS20]|eukprot:XP_008604851.1 hypothetical protein SDRG_01115 [Saprolegnia diclina VS20]